MLRRPSYARANAQRVQAGQAGKEGKDAQGRVGIYRTIERNDQKDARRKKIILNLKHPFNKKGVLFFTLW